MICSQFLQTKAVSVYEDDQKIYIKLLFHYRSNDVDITIKINICGLEVKANREKIKRNITVKPPIPFLISGHSRRYQYRQRTGGNCKNGIMTISFTKSDKAQPKKSKSSWQIRFLKNLYSKIPNFGDF